MGNRDYFKDLMNQDLIQRCDDMMVDPNCIVNIFKILTNANKNSESTLLETDMRNQIQIKVVNQIKEEIFGYDFDGTQIIFMYDFAHKIYQKKQDLFGSEITMNSLYSNDVRNNLKLFYSLESDKII